MEAADDCSEPPAPSVDIHADRLGKLNNIVSTHEKYPFTRDFKFNKHLYVGQIRQEDVEEFLCGLESLQGCRFNMLKGGEQLKENNSSKERETFTINGKEYIKARLHCYFFAASHPYCSCSSCV